MPFGLRAAALRGTGEHREAAASWLAARWPLLATAALLGVLTDLLLAGPLTTVLDVRIHEWMGALPHTGPDLVLAHVLDHTGQRWLVTPVVIAAALWACRRRRSWSSLWLVLGTIFAMNVVIAIAKFTLDRGLAITGDPSLFVPNGQAFPSGHAANAASAAALLVLLVARARGTRIRRSSALVAVVVPSTVMTVVSLYLGFHWFSDLLAGSLLGVLMVRAGAAVEGRLGPRLRRRRPRVSTPFDTDLPETEAARLASARAADPARDRAPHAQLRRRPGATTA
ncbi:Membrane-associated phospholipid phosphatase [Quadrisphaera granulorum]|uniref:Membrane-associated phospholipid phosphatase n=2 Tax=Quadrisphaera granulorum TaxID=317664 RepID=A0A316A4U6_9ACTN|nr:membrane-associated phospholipid phosphatase [Quadrisphaera granulorum]SZE97303.1 Membrane-associated phospholipid phosphatase [Quadrisphaera granulorum]